MPAELFRFALPSTPARRRASVLPISIAAHVVLISAAVMVPILADGDLPPPVRQLNSTIMIADPAPPPPPVTLKPPPSQQTPTASPDKAPLEAPAEIKPENMIELSPRGSGLPDGDDAGTPLGIADSVGPPVAPLPPPPPVERTPMRIGGRIQAPRRLVTVAPVYPPIAQAARKEGTVEIEALIGEDGKVRNAKVIAGTQLLNEAALTAVRQWVFTPTRLNGEPVAVIMTVTVVFSLQ
jgi:protein TonB